MRPETVSPAGGTDRLLTGWGRTAPSRSRVLEPLPADQLSELVASRPARGVLARGAGRSYGDAAQNAGGYVLDPISALVRRGARADPAALASQVRRGIDLNAPAGTVRAGAGVTFGELLTALVPRGLLLPVLPGTRHVTVGGAVAADVHGKNQHREGSIASWIQEIELLDGRGQLRRLSPDHDREGFLATVGGMGLTGIILAVTLRLLPIRSCLVRVTSHRLPDLDALLTAIEHADGRYVVAWIDPTSSGRSLGRGIVEAGDHLAGPDPAAEPDELGYRPGRPPQAPVLPFCPFTPWTARAFNTLWYRKTPAKRTELAELAAFFHRLDAVSGWNRSLGPRGIIQYQFVVPDGSEKLIAVALERIRRAGGAPYLGTLKRFGPASGAPLSFPMPGWSLAVDMPAGRTGLGPVLDDLDRDVAGAGGRVYLAKDSRLSRGAFGDMYARLADWRETRARLDPAGVFRSDLGRRVGLC